LDLFKTDIPDLYECQYFLLGCFPKEIRVAPIQWKRGRRRSHGTPGKTIGNHRKIHEPETRKFRVGRWRTIKIKKKAVRSTGSDRPALK
jgi:hypothetical protein